MKAMFVKLKHALEKGELISEVEIGYRYSRAVLKVEKL